MVGDKELYFFAGTEIGEGEYEEFSYSGLTYGLLDTFELGICWTLADSDDVLESPVFDGKVNFSLDDESATAIAVGFDNLSGDSDKNGVAIPYVVYTQDFGGIRGHAGYTFERDNEAIFFVLDGDVGDTCLGADWAQINEGSDWESSVSIWYPLEFIDESCALYSYYTFSSDSDENGSLTIEIEYTIS
ncbi:MAG: hypothetical protein NTY09_07120 [bacterium]|nr:hypothetical protein [bacterium]